MTNINFTIYELFIVWILIFCVNIDFVCRPKQLKSKVDRQSLKQNDVNIQRQQDRQTLRKIYEIQVVVTRDILQTT